MDHDLQSREAYPVHVTDSLIASDITENECPASEFETITIKCENNSPSPSYQYLESQDFAEEHSFTESNQNNYPGITQFLCETVMNTDDFIEGSVDDLSTSTSIHVVKNNFFIEKEGHSPGHNALLLDIQSRYGYHFKRNNNATQESEDSNICALEDGDMLGMQYKLHKPGMPSKNITLNNKKINKGMRLHKCDICQKSYVRKYVLARHMAQHNHRVIHSKPNCYLCQMCGKLCYSARCLEAHRHTMHSAEGEYECSDCGNIYSMKRKLKRHIVYVHQRYTPYKCYICKKRFGSKFSLLRHLNWHSGYKAYKCVVCEKVFTQKTNLDIHMVTHTGIKKFSCPICEKSFGLKRSVTRHMKTHENSI